MLPVIEEKPCLPYQEEDHYGWPAYNDLSIVWAFFAKSFFGIQSMANCLEVMVSKYYADRIVGHVSRDSTVLVAQEKPDNTKSEGPVRKVPDHRRGRSHREEQRPQTCPAALHQQRDRSSSVAALGHIPTVCSWGVRRARGEICRTGKGIQCILILI